jgi:uncharacterized membrane protein YhhN
MINSIYLLGIGLIVAIIDWVAVVRGNKGLEYACKPAVMVLIILWLGLNHGFSGFLLWFTLGMAFSLVGDVFLVLPREQFLLGLIAFLLAHVSYILGFTSIPIVFNLPALVILVFIILVAVRLYLRIAQALRQKGRSKLVIPILLYTSTISLMVFTALSTLTGDIWPAGPALLVSAGALLFFISDALLAWNKFVSPFKYGRLANMAAYHLAQLLLALGAVIGYLNLS